MEQATKEHLAECIPFPAEHSHTITSTLGTPDWVIFQIPVVGTSFHEDSNRFVETVRPTVASKLEFEPDNPFDPNAIRVLLSDPDSHTQYHVGYIPKPLAPALHSAVENDTIVVRFEHAYGQPGKVSIAITVAATINFDEYPELQAAKQSFWIYQPTT